MKSLGQQIVEKLDTYFDETVLCDYYDNIYLHLPTFTVSNATDSHTLQDLFLKVNVDKVPTGTSREYYVEVSTMEGMRTTVTDIELVHGYKHSHLPSSTDYPWHDNFSEFCMGTGSYSVDYDGVRSALVDHTITLSNGEYLGLEKIIDTIYYLFAITLNALSVEHISSTPHIYMKVLKGGMFSEPNNNKSDIFKFDNYGKFVMGLLATDDELLKCLEYAQCNDMVCVTLQSTIAMLELLYYKYEYIYRIVSHYHEHYYNVGFRSVLRDSEIEIGEGMLDNSFLNECGFVGKVIETDASHIEHIRYVPSIDVVYFIIELINKKLNAHS